MKNFKIGRRLEKLRKDKGYSRRKVEELTLGKIKQGLLFRIETGKSKSVDFEVLSLLVGIYGASGTWVISGLGPKLTQHLDPNFTYLSRAYRKLSTHSQHSMADLAGSLQRDAKRAT